MAMGSLCLPCIIPEPYPNTAKAKQLDQSDNIVNVCEATMASFYQGRDRLIESCAKRVPLEPAEREGEVKGGADEDMSS